MSVDLRHEMASVMNLCPEVAWDRCTRRETLWSAFGWIAREDGRHDYLVIFVDGEGIVGSSTSSAELSRVFSERFFGHGRNHTDCERVEDVFGKLVHNKIELQHSKESNHVPD
jgi:hypothetical protein